MQTGQTIRDYVLEEQIGAGGFGEVWRARHVTLEKTVAIKVAFRHLSQDPKFRERFFREAQVLAKLEHPNIVTVHDFFSIQDDIFMVMSHVDGGSLQDRIKKLGRIPVNEAIRISRDILEALDDAHQKSFIHRDIKPSNILLDSRGNALLVDFGIVLMVGETRLTSPDGLVGTVEYMSPEQIKNPLQIDHRTDIYSMGCVLYELLSGQPPFGSRDTGSTEYTIMERHIKQQPRPLSSLNSEVDENLESAVMRSLSKNANDRFAGCAQMSRALTRPKTVVPGIKYLAWKLAAGAAMLGLLICVYWLINFIQTDPAPGKLVPENNITDSIQKVTIKPQKTTVSSVLPDACSVFEQAEARTACRKCEALVSKTSKMKCRPDGPIGCQEGENNCWSGYGVFLYKSGSCYEGEFVGRKRQGTGTLRRSDGDLYFGEWQNGQIHGQGVYKWAAGNSADCFVGEFQNNKQYRGLLIGTDQGEVQRFDRQAQK